METKSSSVRCGHYNSAQKSNVEHIEDNIPQFPPRPTSLWFFRLVLNLVIRLGGTGEVRKILDKIDNLDK